MSYHTKKLKIKSVKLITIFNMLIFVHCSNAETNKLEEVIVTAQKRQQSLQEVPIAISVLTNTQLNAKGISSLGDLMNGTLSSLHMQPYANAPSTLVVAIRGNGPGDVGQTTRDSSVAIYLDDVYLARSQALDFELSEIDRIEVLKGPQGTLYGRNATSGAINILTKQPTGEFGLRQRITYGRFNQKESVTHLDLPNLSNFSAKIDLLYGERDGWINNTASGQADFNEIKKHGIRFATNYNADDLVLSYSYSNNQTEMSQNYYQFYRDFLGVFGNEENRESKTRLPITPLKPSESEQLLHSITVDYELNENLQIKSISSYRELENEDQTNFGGTLYFNGFNDRVDVEQNQFSQEIRIIGDSSRFNWIVGLYYFDEAIDETIAQLFTLDIFGLINPQPLTPIVPPTSFDVFSGEVIDPREVVSQLESISVYGQIQYTLPFFSDRLNTTIGLRHTDEEKQGKQTLGGVASYKLEDNRVDPSFTLAYIDDNLNIYGKWSRAFRSGGVNVRSPNLIPFDLEEVDTAEIGAKYVNTDQTFSLNIAVFKTDYDGMFIDVFDPDDLSISDTINAVNKVEVDGFELELNLIPLDGLTTNISYTYLDGEMPLQPNSLSTTNQLEAFNITQTPKHAGTLSLNYQFQPIAIGVLSANLEIVSRSQYHHFPSGGKARPDGYTLINGRVELSDIALRNGDLKISIWGKNLEDKEYIVSSFHFDGASTIQAFGDPRTFGLDLRYEF